MKLFKNLIYEYKKGIRDLALYTCEKEDMAKLTTILDKLNTKYIITNPSNDKINIFFGNPLCLKIFTSFSTQQLENLTPHEDFLLGIMLGYSREEQYNRILIKDNKRSNFL